MHENRLAHDLPGAGCGAGVGAGAGSTRCRGVGGGGKSDAVGAGGAGGGGGAVGAKVGSDAGGLRECANGDFPLTITGGP